MKLKQKASNGCNMSGESKQMEVMMGELNKIISICCQKFTPIHYEH